MEKQKMLCKRFAGCIAFLVSFNAEKENVSAFRRNAQPLPTAMISGVWGVVTNKHEAGNPGTASCLICNLTEDCIACQ